MKTKVTKAYARVVKRLTPADIDVDVLASIEIDPQQQANDFYDYSNVVVNKPWGYEYLIFQNSLVSVWILYIKKGYQTSLHCHPNKKASLIVLYGQAICSILNEKVVRWCAESLIVGKGVFHRTQAISYRGAFVMEVETPVNKRDLVRFQDDYGREKMGYETSNHFLFYLHNYKFFFFLNPKICYNAKKRFGNCNIELINFKTAQAMKDVIKLPNWDMIIILKGQVLDPDENLQGSVGDVIARENIERCLNLQIVGETEVIIVKKIEDSNKLSKFISSLSSFRHSLTIFLKKISRN